MRTECNAWCLTPVHVLAPEEIKAIRAREGLKAIPAAEGNQANPSVANDPVVLAKRKDATVENFLNKARSSVKHGSIIFAPNIPEKKMKNALESYAPNIKPGDVLELVTEWWLNDRKVLDVRHPAEFTLWGVEKYRVTTVRLLSCCR